MQVNRSDSSNQARRAQQAQQAKLAQQPQTAGQQQAAEARQLKAQESQAKVADVTPSASHAAPADNDAKFARRGIAAGQEAATKHRRDASAVDPALVKGAMVKAGLKGRPDSQEAGKSARQRAAEEQLKAFDGQPIPSADDVMGRLQKTEGFKQLNEDERQFVEVGVRAHGPAGQLVRARIDQALKDPGFAKAPPEEQAGRIGAASDPQLPPDPKQTLDELKQDPGWNKLTPAQQKAVEGSLKPGPQGDRFAGLVNRKARDVDFDDDKASAAFTKHIADLATVDQSKQIGPEAKGALMAALSREAAPYPLTDAFTKMMGSEAFQKMSPAERERAIITSADTFLGGHHDGPPSPSPSWKQTKQGLDGLKSYQSLNKTSKERLDRLLSGDNPISAHARAQLNNIQKTPLWQQASAADRASMLKNLDKLGGLPHGADEVTPSPGARGTAKVTGTEKVNQSYAGGQFDGTKHRVQIERDGKTFNVDVVMPNEMKPGEVGPKLDQVIDSIKRLSDDQLKKLKRVVVDPSGEHDGGMYTKGDDGTVHIDPASSQEEAAERFRPGRMSEILTHEVGHLASITPWGQDPSSPQWQRYKQAMEKDGLGVSTYGNSKMQEDFAEAYALYKNSMGDPKTHAEYRKLYPNRFAIIDELVRSQQKKKAA